MLGAKLYQKFMSKALKGIHHRRSKALLLMSEALMKGSCLNLTSLGRHLSGTTMVKHKIKRVDSFLGNIHIQKETPFIYKGMCKMLTDSLSEIWIAVDWSGCCNDEFYILRASILYEGRSIPIYNEIHSGEKCGNPKIQSKFLENLRNVLPSNQKKIIIVTDAGFQTPWFQKVKSLGWEYVGRIRGPICFWLSSASRWQTVNDIKVKMKGRAAYLGKGYLGKRVKACCVCYFVSYKEKAKGRKNFRRKGYPFYPDKENQYRKQNSEHWVLVTSIEGDKKLSHRLVGLYKKRMQIEQNFRDDKNPRFGFGWRYSRCKKPCRIAVLCLIACVATLLLWFIGLAAEKKSLQYQFQPNTVRRKRVLSLLYLAKQILLHKPRIIQLKNIMQGLKYFKLNYQVVL